MERCNEVFDYLSRGKYPDGYNKSQKLSLKRYAQKFTIKEGQLFYGNRRVIHTRTEARSLFSEFHSSPVGGHAGIIKTRSAICSRFYWLGMSVDIDRWVSECDRCQKTGRSLAAAQPLQSIKWSEEPVVIPTKRSVGTQLSAGTLRYHRSKGIQATDKSIRKGTSILEQIGQIQSSAAVNRANHESDKGPAAKRICVKEEEEEEHISDPLLPHNSMYEPRDSDASDQSDLESEYGDAKYIVSASSLRELFERCPICTKHCKVKRRRRGLLLSFSQTCPHCSYRRRWQSQMEELLEVPVTEDQSENENSDCENPSKEILAAHVFINQRGSYQNQNRLGQNTTEYSP
ncbi:uncharacterized protein LOC110161145 isoform X2 [Boleophthalmus pectinirostris]|uniref:uncharacterized protein LOC110161145 isoform X2 n=1 Tax=Boleophthalmus pectinirostris TaxID=150288 RepID=UPI00242EF602|nr:uncharacterized protein LOC110161145 isoform X2 [Boleophthalmus pectinirostris]